MFEINKLAKSDTLNKMYQLDPPNPVLVHRQRQYALRTLRQTEELETRLLSHVRSGRRNPMGNMGWKGNLMQGVGLIPQGSTV